ncbi:MAG: DUF2313 domain-containing protein [Clostridia bacterium]|nr:DUF2313 domain-containing protein [Clostridia bacterium]
MSDQVHKILMDQLPEWFKPVLEYIAIMYGGSVELARLDEDAEQIRLNDHIQTADATTIRYWERFLGIASSAGDTLAFRRDRVMMRINQTVPYTVWYLRERLTELYGDAYTLEVNPAECWIRIIVTSDRYGAISLLHDLIYSYVPAHLYVYSNQQVSNVTGSDAYYAARMSRTFEQTIPTGGN